MEVPKGSMTKNEVSKVLAKSTTFVYRENSAIQGFISFTRTNKAIHLEFIYARKRRHGIGTLIMKRVAMHAIKNKLVAIDSEVSIMDRRAYGFYSSLGFKKSKKINYFLYKTRAEPSMVMANTCRSK